MKWPAIDHEKWLEKIKKELKTESLDSSRIKLSGNMEFDPFFNPQTTALNTYPIKSFPTLKIGMAFNLSDADTHRAIHHFLSFDLNVLHLNFAEDWDIAEILDGVYTDMLFFDISGSQSAVRKALNFLSKNESTAPPNISILKTEDTTASSSDNYFIRTEYINEDNPLNILHACKNEWSSLSRTGEESFIKIVCPISENLLESIPFFRALRILFESLLPGSKLLIECRCEIHADNQNLNTVLIKAGSIASIAQMAGVDHLYFKEMDELNSINHFTSLLNIQNIMQLESHMNDVSDPLSGSHSIEYLTGQWLDKIL